MPVSVSKLSFDLTAANNGLTFPVGGSFLRCTAATEDFLISIDGAPAIPLGAARAIEPKNPDGTPQRFSNFSVTRSATAAAATNTIELITGDVDYKDDRGVIASIAAGLTIRQTPSGSLNGSIADKAPVATGGANSTLLIAASTVALRAGVNVVNTGTVALRIAGADADAAAGGKGDYLAPGVSRYYATVGALYAAGVGGIGACAVAELLW